MYHLCMFNVYFKDQNWVIFGIFKIHKYDI